jgi:hypothetical protein
MSVFEALGISVCAGITVLLLVWATKILWLWVFEKLYLKLSCRHLTDIGGKWLAEYQDVGGNTCYEEVELCQYGYRIEGTQSYRIVYKDGRPEKRKLFKLRGILRNDLFAAYYWNTDRRQKGSGTFTLAVAREGNVMRGKYAWFDVEADLVDSGDHEWKRA